MSEPFAADSSAAPPTRTPASRPRRWGRWLVGMLALGVLLVLVALQFLDPWLRRQLEQHVTTQTRGQYHLQVGALRTRLWPGAVYLSQVRLRPAAEVADTLPRVRLDMAQLRVAGVGWLALLRKGLVPIDSVVLDSVRLEVLAWARRPTKNANKSLHERLPLPVEGLRIGGFALRHAQASYRPNADTEATAWFRRADLGAHDLLISAGGAADSQRLGYAAAWRLQLLGTEARAAGHRLALGSLRIATADRRLQLDSLRIWPESGAVPQRARVDLLLPRLCVTGLDAAALRHQRRFRADSLLIQAPQLTLTLPGRAAPGRSQAGRYYLRRLDLAHLVVRAGYLRVAGIAEAPIVREINLGATTLRFDPGAPPDAQGFCFAQAWEVALGKSQAMVAAHALTLGSLRLATKAGRFDLRAVRVRPPAPGQGLPGGLRIDLTLPSLALTGLNAAAFQHRRRLLANSLLIDGPRLHFTPPTQPPPPIWKLLSKLLRRADLAQLRVRHAAVQVGGTRQAPEVHDLNLAGQAIRIDSVGAREPRRIAYARAWQASSGLVAVSFDAPYYRATSQHLRLDTNAQTFRLEGLALIPTYSALGMNQHKRYQAPAITVRAALLAARGLDFAALARAADFRAAQVTALNPVVRIASDGRGPINPHASKISPEQMRKLPNTVDVRRLDLVNGNLYSSYRSPLTPIPGTLSITHFNGSFRNLSNDARRQTAATPLTGRASAYLQNRCRLDAQAAAFLLDPRGRHRVWGTFGPGPFAMLNSMTVPTRLVQFRRGDVHQLRFDLRADRQRVTGTLWTEYSGLQMKLLSYQEETIKKSLLKSVVSKAANVLVIRDQNPRKRGKLVAGAMTSTREPRFSVFTLWRQGIVSGLFNNVGIPQKLAQKLSETKDEGPLPK